MGGGGKSQTTTQQVSIPPEVLARYNAVNARAEDVASRPFQQYGTTAEAFVAPLTQAQQQGIQQTQQYGQTAQPYFGAATDQLLTAQQQGQAGLGAAYPFMQQGIQTGQQLGGEAYTGYQNLPGAFLPSFAQAQQGIQQGLGAGQALLGGGLGYTLAGSQGVSPQQFSGAALQPYMSPFLGNVVQQTMAAQAQQNAQQRNALTGNAIRAGAFGGDRAGIAQANLAYQQNLANQQTLANLLQGGYGQALGAFQQQQGVDLAAQQANRAALQQTGQSLAGLGQQAFGMGTGAAQQQAGLGQALAGIYGQQAQGLAGLGQQQFGQGLTAAQQQAQLAQQGYGMGAGTAQALAGLGQGAQAAGLQGAQAMLGAGQIQQQTEQAGKQALYNQFLQQQGYPFQVAQFLANIAMGTGALSGSTTTTQQPSSFFSDRKVKENVRKIGETEDGLPIYKFRYKGDKTEQTHIGYMADEVEKKHPDAVGEYGGVKTVDYNKVNARESMGGAVHEGGLGRGAYAYGGADHVDPNDLQAIIRQQQQMYGPNMGGLYGGSAQQTPHGGKANVPTGGLHVGKLVTAGAAPRQREGGLRGAMGNAQEAKQMVEGVIGKYNPQTKQHEGSLIDQIRSAGKSISSAVGGGEAAAKSANTAVANAAAATPSAEDLDKASKALGLYAHGGLVPRAGYKFGGEDVYKADQSYVPEEVLESEDKKPELMTAKGGTGGGGGGGKSGASTALGIAGTLANFIPGVGPAIGTGLKAASMFFNEGGVVPRHGYQQGGANNQDPHSVEAISDYIIGEESAGDPRARAKTSSAAGLGQFTDATARTVLQRNPEIAAQLEQQGVTYNPNQRGFTAQFPASIQRQMVAAHVRQQQELLRQQGYDPTRENVRMNWFLGESGGPAFLNAMREDPNAPATAYADPAAIKANQSIFFTKDGQPRSVQEVYSFLNKGGGGGGVGGGRAVASTQAGAPAGDQKGGIGNFLTSSKFLVPLGTGLLTMASSPSRYLGAAALQGLGAGLAAMNVPEEQEVKIQRGKEEIATIQQANIQNSLKFMPDGTRIVWLKGGKFVTADVYMDMLEKGLKPELLGYVPSDAEKRIQEAGGVNAGAADITGGFGSTRGPQNIAGISLSPQAMQAAKREAAITYQGGPQSEEQKKASLEYSTAVRNAAREARPSISSLGDIAQNISKAAQLGGVEAMGIAYPLRAQVFSFANTLLRAAGQKEIFSGDTVEQIQNKLSTIQGELQASLGGERSFSAMQSLIGATPNTSMNPEAASYLAADLWVARQRQIDRDNFRMVYGRGSNGSYADADYYFNEQFSPDKYKRERAAIQHIIKKNPDIINDMRMGKMRAPMIDKGFTNMMGEDMPGMSRYFVAGTR
jgi:hypothetical protein